MKTTKALLAAAVLVAGCSSQDATAPESLRSGTTASFDAGAPAAGTRIQACKFALDTETIGKSFDFSFSAVQPGTLLGTFSLVAAQQACDPATATTIWASETIGATDLEVTETPKAGAQLVYWRHVDENGRENDVFPGNPGYTSATGTYYEAPAGTTKLIVKNAKGGMIYAKNKSVPVLVGEGCTPGYWKQSQHFGSWTAPYVPVHPGTTFNSVFGRNAFATRNGRALTLLEVLNLGGGGLNALGRHTAAALLNAAHPTVNYQGAAGPADVIAAFQVAFDARSYTPQKDLFETENERGCPLGLDPGAE